MRCHCCFQTSHTRGRSPTLSLSLMGVSQPSLGPCRFVPSNTSATRGPTSLFANFLAANNNTQLHLPSGQFSSSNEILSPEQSHSNFDTERLCRTVVVSLSGADNLVCLAALLDKLMYLRLTVSVNCYCLMNYTCFSLNRQCLQSWCTRDVCHMCACLTASFFPSLKILL